LNLNLKTINGALTILKIIQANTGKYNHSNNTMIISTLKQKVKYFSFTNMTIISVEN